ncbi:hypothetical protein PO909_000693 [Leuciscus waleckii]
MHLVHHLARIPNLENIIPDHLEVRIRLYYSIFKREYGASSGDAMLENLQERLEVYNKEQCETCARMESTTDGQTVIALCTPVMKSIHRLERHSGEMLFMDSSGKLDVPDSWFMGLQFEREKDCPTVPLIASTQGTQEIGTQAGTSTPTQGTQAGTPQDGSGTEASSQREHLKGRLRSMFNDFVDKLQNDETFQAPIQSLVSSYESILTDSGLISALSTFGKMRSAAASNIRMQPRKGLQMSTQIGVQPTAVARRKTPLGGRQALITGRPPKRARREHNYGKSPAQASNLGPSPALARDAQALARPVSDSSSE